ncbi:TetR/AcrR family transcriptional repressor of nem operon [Luteibacter sp. HA06]
METTIGRRLPCPTYDDHHIHGKLFRMNAVGTKRDRTHRRIVEAASRGVRRAGFRGIGVAEVMKEVGLTHGGFYAHFDSRNALLSEALVHASEDIGSVIRENVDALVGLGHTRFSAFVSTYLSDAQICGQENGCPVAALCSEMPQQSGEVALASRTVIGNLHRLVSDALPEHSRQSAWTVAGALIGAMQLARSLGSADEGRAVLAAARADLVAHYDTQ